MSNPLGKNREVVLRPGKAVTFSHDRFSPHEVINALTEYQGARIKGSDLRAMAGQGNPQQARKMKKQAGKKVKPVHRSRARGAYSTGKLRLAQDLLNKAKQVRRLQGQEAQSRFTYGNEGFKYYEELRNFLREVEEAHRKVSKMSFSKNSKLRQLLETILLQQQHLVVEAEKRHKAERSLLKDLQERNIEKAQLERRTQELSAEVREQSYELSGRPVVEREVIPEEVQLELEKLRGQVEGYKIEVEHVRSQNQTSPGESGEKEAVSQQPGLPAQPLSDVDKAKMKLYQLYTCIPGLPSEPSQSRKNGKEKSREELEKENRALFREMWELRQALDKKKYEEEQRRTNLKEELAVVVGPFAEAIKTQREVVATVPAMYREEIQTRDKKIASLEQKVQEYKGLNEEFKQAHEQNMGKMQELSQTLNRVDEELAARTTNMYSAEDYNKLVEANGELVRKLHAAEARLQGTVLQAVHEGDLAARDNKIRSLEAHLDAIQKEQEQRAQQSVTRPVEAGTDAAALQEDLKRTMQKLAESEEAKLLADEALDRSSQQNMGLVNANAELNRELNELRAKLEAQSQAQPATYSFWSNLTGASPKNQSSATSANTQGSAVIAQDYPHPSTLKPGQKDGWWN